MTSVFHKIFLALIVFSVFATYSQAASIWLEWDQTGYQIGDAMRVSVHMDFSDQPV